MAGFQSALLPLRSLIIVCCHAIWIGGSTKGSDEREWFVIYRRPSLAITRLTNFPLSSLCHFLVTHISDYDMSMRNDTFFTSMQSIQLPAS